MSDSEHEARSESLTESLHRPRPDLARWVRLLAASGCVVAGVVLLVRGLVESDALWLWLGAVLTVVGVAGVPLALWMFRRNL